MENFTAGQYAYDLDFLRRHAVQVIELTGDDPYTRIAIVPAWQGRVMTSTAAGPGGRSFGWINRRFIASGLSDDRFNAYGGEERLWLGPEGGPYSFYFKDPSTQTFADWKVPAIIDTEEFPLTGRTRDTLTFRKNGSLTNASGTHFDFCIDRSVRILAREDVLTSAGLDDGDGLRFVGYETVNRLTNTGASAWTLRSGLPSLWLLSMLDFSENTVVFIPYEENAGNGPAVNDDYFGKPGIDRLRLESGMVYFKIDGKKRSKIGLPFGRAKAVCGSYDAVAEALTLLWFSLPEAGEARYVNSRWGHQADPYDGDVWNAYNDGPLDDGSVMGPFYEIESSSPGAVLSPGEMQTHIQRIVHFEGHKEALSRITENLFGVTVEKLEKIFS